LLQQARSRFFVTSVALLVGPGTPSPNTAGSTQVSTESVPSHSLQKPATTLGLIDYFSVYFKPYIIQIEISVFPEVHSFYKN
jgi:hypothetical protein